MMKVKEKNEKSTRKHVKSQEGFHWIMKFMREFADPGTAGDLILWHVFRVLYVIPRIVSVTFLFREWVVHSSEEKEKVADAKYCATV